MYAFYIYYWLLSFTVAHLGGIALTAMTNVIKVYSRSCNDISVKQIMVGKCHRSNMVESCIASGNKALIKVQQINRCG